MNRKFFSKKMDDATMRFDDHMQEILKSILKHPISKLFYFPVHDEYLLEELEGINISELMNLQTIEKKLHENKYKSISEFSDDFYLIHQQTIQYFDEFIDVKIAADELINIFQKEIKRHFNRESWCHQVNHIQNKIGKLIYSPPPLASLIFNASEKSHHTVDEKLPTEEDLKSFVEIIEKIEKTEDINNIKDILKENQPNLLGKTHSVIDITHVRPDTFSKLKTYVDKALASS
ncbi:Bromodomain containing protein [Tritrichomonas foetus]|uniref:Bromodomain containing protein n=1 Tax=Tritrichomonas foetus TaxID=1144522 RepID=A0A1J4KB36_9EUKA|nr:Bromodomain containing protein [Tritrichomonas foetus]|eukprot:OHT08631.1 Bromodomain containing protein [Tritrichomonas foetus]